MVLSKVIKEHITRNGENKIYTVSDFADLNNDMLVTRVLISYQMKQQEKNWKKTIRRCRKVSFMVNHYLTRN